MQRRLVRDFRTTPRSEYHADDCRDDVTHNSAPSSPFGAVSSGSGTIAPGRGGAICLNRVKLLSTHKSHHFANRLFAQSRFEHVAQGLSDPVIPSPSCSTYLLHGVFVARNLCQYIPRILRQDKTLSTAGQRLFHTANKPDPLSRRMGTV